MDKNLFFYELEGRGYTFENMTWLGNCFEDNFLNMAYEMWCASASREGYVVVPKEPTCEMVSEGFKEMCVVDMRDFSDESAVNIYKAMLEAVEK